MSGTFVPKILREKVAVDAGYRCGYCLSREAIVGAPMEIDYLVPESLGGLTIERNLWLACALCNGHKANRVAAIDPETGEQTRLFNPRGQVWSAHFRCSPEGELIIGSTPSGRATVVALNLNRISLVKARQLWAEVGWHPPKDSVEESG